MTPMISEILEIQNNQLDEDEQTIPTWYDEAINRLNYPICKDGDYFVLLVLHDYNPIQVMKNDKLYELLEPELEAPITIFIAIYFLRDSRYQGVKCYLPSGNRFEHYHSGISNDWDCIGKIRKPTFIQNLYDGGNAAGMRFIKSLKNGLDIIVIDSATQNQPDNGDDCLELPDIDSLYYDEENYTQLFST